MSWTLNNLETDPDRAARAWDLVRMAKGTDPNAPLLENLHRERREPRAAAPGGHQGAQR